MGALAGTGASTESHELAEPALQTVAPPVEAGPHLAASVSWSKLS